MWNCVRSTWWMVGGLLQRGHALNAWFTSKDFVSRAPSRNEERRSTVNEPVMPPSHCRECCLRTNTNWHSLRIAQHRIDSNYFVLVRCHFRISSQPNTNVLECSKHSYWPCESILFVLRRIASPNVVSIRVSSYWFVSHRCTFVSIRCTFALGFAACLLRLSTLQYDAQRSDYRTGSHMFALVRVSSY